MFSSLNKAPISSRKLKTMANDLDARQQQRKKNITTEFDSRVVLLVDSLYLAA